MIRCWIRCLFGVMLPERDYTHMQLLTMEQLQSCTDPKVLRDQAGLRLWLNGKLVGWLYREINWTEAGQLNGWAFDLER